MVKRLELDVRRGAGRPGVLAAFVIVVPARDDAVVPRGHRRAAARGAARGPRRSARRSRRGRLRCTSPFRAVGDWVERRVRGSQRVRGPEEAERRAQAARSPSLQEAKAENDRLRALVAVRAGAGLRDRGRPRRSVGRPTRGAASIVIDRGTCQGRQGGRPGHRGRAAWSVR